MRMGRRIGTGVRSLTAEGVVFDLLKTTTAVRPGLILVPGGGWTTIGSVLAEAEAYRTLGWPVFAIKRYTLSSSSQPNPQLAINEIKNFIKHVRDNASLYGVHASLLAGVGYSAGAQLLFMAATTGTTGTTRPSAVAGMSGPYRLQALTSAALTAALIYCGVTQLSGNEAALDAVSPFDKVRPDCCAIRMVHNDGESEAEGEVASTQSDNMETRALAVGMAAGDVSKVIKVGTTHPVSDVADTSAWLKDKLGVSW